MANVSRPSKLMQAVVRGSDIARLSVDVTADGFVVEAFPTHKLAYRLLVDETKRKQADEGVEITFTLEQLDEQTAARMKFPYRLGRGATFEAAFGELGLVD